MRGLPYSVKIFEIEDFFRGFGYVKTSIKIGENPYDNLRTGDGMILFENPDECQKAMRQLNG